MLKLGVVGLVLVALAVPVSAAGAAPNADTPPPYTAFTMDGVAGSTIMAAGSVVDNDSTGDITATATGAPISIFLTTSAGTMSITPAPSFTVGQTYNTTFCCSGTTFQFLSACNDDVETGTLTILEAVVDSTGRTYSSFAASYTLSCDGTPPVVGDIRYNSNIPYREAVTGPAAGWDLGSAQVGVDGAPQQISVTNPGAQDVTFGTAALSQSKPGFVISADTCSGQTLVPGGSCGLTVVPHPSAVGVDTGNIFMLDNTPRGRRVMPLKLTGTSGPPVVAAPGPNRVIVSWQDLAHPLDQPVSLVKIFRGTSPGGLVLLTSAGGNECLDGGLTAGTTYYYSLQPTGNVSQPLSPPTPAQAADPWPLAGAGLFVPVAPARLLDTRTGNGAPKHALGPGGSLTLSVTKRAGIPSQVSAVVLNLTGTQPTASTYLTAYPADKARPTASSLNLKKGLTVANLVTVPVSSTGTIKIYNNSGSTQVVADALGFYTSAAYTVSNGEQYQPYDSPARLLDTRQDGGALPGGYYLTLPIEFPSSYAASVNSIAVNVTVTGARKSGYLSTWDSDGPPPQTSTLNFAAGATVANMTVLPILHSSNPSTGAMASAISIYNGSAGAVQVIVDIVGFYDNNLLPDGLRFHPLTPVRIVDSRTGLGIAHALGAGSTGAIDPGANADYYTTALDLNMTAVGPTASTYLTVWPDGPPRFPRPSTSNLNASPGQVVANHVMTSVGFTNESDVYNGVGTTNVVVDLDGTFEAWPMPGDGGPASLERPVATSASRQR